MKGNRRLLAISGGTWRRALVYGIPAALMILSCFANWFVLADRYIVFLYYHDMGPSVPDTSPFSRVTTSRYWMAGLVAAGGVMLLYLCTNWLVGRWSKRTVTPSWWQVWLVTAPLMLLGIPTITMRFNEPVMPWTVAAGVTVVVLASLALALLPGDLAANNPSRLIWLATDGWGLALIILTLPHLEDVRAWLTAGRNSLVMISAILLISGLLWLILLSFVRAWMRIPADRNATLLLAGFCVAYLFMPFVHYTIGTNGYFYLTNSDNFFARSLEFQLLAWLITALVVWGIVRFRLVLAERFGPEGG